MGLCTSVQASTHVVKIRRVAPITPQNDCWQETPDKKSRGNETEVRPPRQINPITTPHSVIQSGNSAAQGKMENCQLAPGVIFSLSFGIIWKWFDRACCITQVTKFVFFFPLSLSSPGCTLVWEGRSNKQIALHPLWPRSDSKDQPWEKIALNLMPLIGWLTRHVRIFSAVTSSPTPTPPPLPPLKLPSTELKEGVDEVRDTITAITVDRCRGRADAWMNEWHTFKQSCHSHGLQVMP